MQFILIKGLLLYLIAIWFVIFNLSDIGLLNASSLMPMLDVMMIYYFSVYKSDVFPYWFLFLLGLWSDALNAIPLGITSLCYIIAVKFFIVVNQRLVFKENFSQILQQFIGFLFLILFLKWMMLSIYNSNFYNPKNALLQMLISPIFYIVMHRFFDYLSHKLLGSRVGA